MYRDLKAACANPAAYDLKSQQRSLNHFVKQYNHIRPYEALEMKTSTDIHDFSTSPFPERIPNFDYDNTYKVLQEWGYQMEVLLLGIFISCTKRKICRCSRAGKRNLKSLL